MDTLSAVGEVAARASGGGISQLLIFGLIFVGMWFLLIAPNRKRQKAHQRMLSELRPGDRVLLAAGILGKILRAKDSRLTVEIASGVRVEVLRGYVQRRVQAGEFADGGGGEETEVAEGAVPAEGEEEKKPARRSSKNRPAKK
jgi:preprotein translocase subunit YajC